MLVFIPCDARAEDFDFDELDSAVEEKTELSFDTLMSELLSGRGISDILKDRIRSVVKEDLFLNRSYLRFIVLIGIISAFINIAAQDIRDKSVSDIIGLIGRIMIIGSAAASFKSSVSVLSSAAGDITDVVNSAVPFILMLLTASGSASAIGSAGIMSLGTSMTASAVNDIITPVLVTAVTLRLLNILSKKQLLDKLSSLFMSALSLGLKACAYFFVFLITFEKISGGIINRSVGGAFKSLVKMVPVIGDVIAGAGEITLGTVGAVKNGAGLVLTVIIAFISLAPLLKIGMTAFAFKLIAALLEPVCDKQTIDIIDTVGEGNMLILSALFIISLMFVVSCAILMCGVS